MWITGKIPIARHLSNIEMIERLPSNEAEIVENQVVVKTNRIPIFAEHKLILFTTEKNLHYKLGIPAMWPLIIFLFLSVFFFAGLKPWNIMVVGSIIATGISFALYVINDKGARSYINNYLGDIIIDEFVQTDILNSNICPKCGTKLHKNNKFCQNCGYRKPDDCNLQITNHTGNRGSEIIYHLKKEQK